MIDIEEVLSRQPQRELVVSFGEAQLVNFRTEGFISLDRITTDEEVAWLREVYDWLFDEKIEAVRGGHFDLIRPYDSDGVNRLPQILRPEIRLPQLRETTFWRNGRKLASQLMGVADDLLDGWGHMIRKPPKIGEALPWHQDEAYWDPAMIYRALGCWLPLDDATVENGCMSFVPSSHWGEVRTHRHVNDDPAIHALFTEPSLDEIAMAQPAPVPAGGAVFHHSRTLHASGPNTTDRVRRAYANEWQLAPAKADAAAERPWINQFQKAWAERALS